MPTNMNQAALQNTFEGFDFARPQDQKKSAKDSFAANAKLAGLAPTNDKAALGQWFEQKVRPGFEADGHKVTNVTGDKFTYGNQEGNFTVDYGRGAGADGGALAWQAEAADDATRARYPGAPQAAPVIGQNPNVSRGMAVMPGQSDLMAQILASLQEQSTPDGQELLLQSLR